MHKIIFSPEKKVIEKNVCLPYLKFQTRYPKHTYFFIWPKVESLSEWKSVGSDQLVSSEARWNGFTVKPV